LELASRGETNVTSAEIRGGTGYGVHVREKSRASIREVDVAGTALAAICVSGGAPRVADSTFSGSEQSGAFITGGSRPAFSNWRIEKNGSGGIEVRDEADPDVRDSTIANNTGDAVLAQEAGRGRFTRCVLTGSTDAGARVLTKADPRFTKCRFEDNA